MDLHRIAAHLVSEEEHVLLSKEDVARWVGQALDADPSSLNFTSITFEASGGFIGATGGGESEGRSFYFRIHNRPYSSDDGVKFDPGTTQYPMEVFWED